MYLTLNGRTYQNVQALTSGDNIRFVGESLTGVEEITSPVTLYAENGMLIQSYVPTDYKRQEIQNGSWLLTNSSVLEPVEYDLLESTAAMVKLLMQDKKPETDDEKIQVSALWPEWTAGSYTAGDIYTVDGAPWECYQSYDNAVYPDIQPGNSAWFTFNRPLHGTSRQTARAFVQPTGAHDIYKAGEWAVFSGKFYECTQNTAYSPVDYAAAWAERT